MYAPRRTSIDPHVVDEHRRRKNRIRRRIAVEVAANGQIHNDEKALVEDPVPQRLDAGAGNAEVQRIVDKKPYGERIPFDRESVEGVGERAAGDGPDVRERRVAGVPGSVDRRAGGGGRAALVLHDVQLAAGGPPDRPDVLAQEPERRPEPLPRRELEARLDATGRDF